MPSATRAFCSTSSIATPCSRLMRAMMAKMSSHDQRREAERGLVEQHQRGLADEGAADREHLLLAAGEIAGQLLAALREAREVAVDQLGVELAPRWRPVSALAAATRFSSTVRSRTRGAPRARAPCPRARQLVRPRGRRCPRRRTGCGRRRPRPFSNGRIPGRRLERRRLARAVRRRAARRSPAGHLERQAAQDLDAVIVDDLDVLDGQAARSIGASSFGALRRRRSWRERRHLPARASSGRLAQPASTQTLIQSPAGSIVFLAGS